MAIHDHDRVLVVVEDSCDGEVIGFDVEGGSEKE